MSKKTYKVSVGTTSTIIVPDVNEASIDAYADGAYAAGGYAVATNGLNYWTPAGGTASAEPTHRLGVETTGGVEWVALTHVRNVVISADPDVGVWLGIDSIATASEGISFGGEKAFAHGNSAGKIEGITDSGTASIAVELTASAQ